MNLPFQLKEKQREVIEDLTGRLPILLEVAAVILRQVAALQVTPATEKPAAPALAGPSLPPESVENVRAGDESIVQGSPDRGESSEDWMRSFCDLFWESERVKTIVLSVKKHFDDFRLGSEGSSR